jgi:hypothetical protein
MSKVTLLVAVIFALYGSTILTYQPTNLLLNMVNVFNYLTAVNMLFLVIPLLVYVF